MSCELTLLGTNLLILGLQHLPVKVEPAVQTTAVVASAATGALVAPGPRLGEVWVYSRAGAPLDCSLQVKSPLRREALRELAGVGDQSSLIRLLSPRVPKTCLHAHKSPFEAFLGLQKAPKVPK